MIDKAVTLVKRDLDF